ncbi:hypothetical protein DE146DRAFT_791170 [Phaeosphaeria sp. MPI-PUGE-AT-0046c]|nr:hypothetical protein DE146DRAFT_791170 [Phaeosphaeria sp. MPI-PUGE-AT-0046c]
MYVKDASKKHLPGEKAVIKIKYQIEEITKDLAQCPDDTNEGARETQEYISGLQGGLRQCMEPWITPNSDTWNEVAALSHLADHKCSSTPWLLNCLIDVLPSSGVHRKAVAGGYIVFVLMTKVPGKELDSGDMGNLMPVERENLREDFKDAIKKVWECGLECRDKGFHNLKWDKEERKWQVMPIFYIVDFEHSSFASEKRQKSLEFTEDEYWYWGLSESYYIRK